MHSIASVTACLIHAHGTPLKPNFFKRQAVSQKTHRYILTSNIRCHEPVLLAVQPSGPDLSVLGLDVVDFVPDILGCDLTIVSVHCLFDFVRVQNAGFNPDLRQMLRRPGHELTVFVKRPYVVCRVSQFLGSGMSRCYS